MEEENNNNEKTIVDKGKEIVKNEAKKAGTKLLKKIIPAIAPAIGIFFLILFVIGLLNLVQWAIQDMFSSILSLFNDDNPEYSSSEIVAESPIYIDDAGYYKLKSEELSEQILEDIEEQKVSNVAIGFDIKELESMIEKYIEAEVQTSFPKTGKNGPSQNDVDGMITIKRASASTGENDQPLEYKDYDYFCSAVNSGNTDALNWFSINPQTFRLCVARKGAVTEYYDYDGKLIKREGVPLVQKEIDYRKKVENYAVPLNFFVALHLISQDTEFMQDFIDMVVGKDKVEPIVLTYIDTEQINTTIYEYDGYYDKEVKYTDSSGNEIDYPNGGESSDYDEIDNRNVSDPKYTDESDEIQEFYKKVEKKYTSTLKVTKADTWIRSCDIIVDGIIRVQTQPEENVVETRVVKDEKIGPHTFTINDPTTGEVITKKRTEKIYIKESCTEIPEYNYFLAVDKGSEMKVDEFIELIKSYPKVRNNIETSPSNLLIFLQRKENTQKLEKIMRYVLSMLTGTDFGITTLEELEMLFREEYTIIGGNSAENYIKAWENYGLWLYETEQSETFPQKYMTEDGLNYIVYENATEKHNNIAYGWATFITNSRTGTVQHPVYGLGDYNWKDEFATEGIIVEDLQNGGYVDKEAATAVFQNEILPYFVNIVDNYLETHLSEYKFTQAQKDALISVAYQYGNITGFAEAYKKSLNGDGTIDGEKLKNNYGKFNYTSKFGNRKYADWLLFTEGKYIDRIGKVQRLASSLVDAAYMVADYFINSGVDVHYAGASVYPRCTADNGIKVPGGGIAASWTLPIKYPGRYGIVCATFVSLSIWKAGLIAEEDFNGRRFHGTGGLHGLLTSSKYADEWERVDSWEDLQEGDVVFVEGHVFIYIDGNKCLDQGYCVISSGGLDSRGRLTSAGQYQSTFRSAYRYVGK